MKNTCLHLVWHLMQLYDTISTTGINICAIEPEFSFLQDLQPSKQSTGIILDRQSQEV